MKIVGRLCGGADDGEGADELPTQDGPCTMRSQRQDGHDGRDGSENAAVGGGESTGFNDDGTKGCPVHHTANVDQVSPIQTHIMPEKMLKVRGGVVRELSDRL